MSKQNSSNQNDSLTWSFDFQCGHFYQLQNLSRNLVNSIVLKKELPGHQLVISLFNKKKHVLHYCYTPNIKRNINMLDKKCVVKGFNIDKKENDENV